MIELRGNNLVFSFPELHENATCIIEFQRTLRIPDDNREYPLPASLGRFPLKHVEDYKENLPASWSHHGGVLMPMYQSEALWINFKGVNDYPFAIKIATGKINAVNGKPWTNELNYIDQDYVVTPDQPWIDGFCIQKGLIRQFVAMPLGSGFSVEEQLTGAAEFGGIQIISYPMKPEVYERICSNQRLSYLSGNFSGAYCESKSMEFEMGIAPGGLMRQEIYEDPYGINAWDTEHASRCFVHILNSNQWQKTTGMLPPGKPITAYDYKKAGVPWFDYYDDNLTANKGSQILAGVDSVEAKKIKNGDKPSGENGPVQIDHVVHLGDKKKLVTQGVW